MQRRRQVLLEISLGLAGSATVGATSASAASAASINQGATAALSRLYAQQPKTRVVGERAKAILVFPRIVKAGFLVGGLTGDGVLWVNGHAVGYYNISAGSFGLQAGAQTYSYALFIMNDAALDYLRKSDGWAIGSGPSVVVVDKGAAGSINSTTLSQDVYAFAFGQQGLMAGLGLEGSKITQVHRS